MSHVTYRGNFPTPTPDDPESPTKKDGSKKKILVRRAGEPKKGVWQEPTEREFVKQYYNDRRLNPFHPDVTIYRAPDFYGSNASSKRPGKRTKPSLFEKPAPQVEIANYAPAIAELVHPPVPVAVASGVEPVVEAAPVIEPSPAPETTDLENRPSIPPSESNV